MTYIKQPPYHQRCLNLYTSTLLQEKRSEIMNNPIIHYNVKCEDEIKT